MHWPHEPIIWGRAARYENGWLALIAMVRSGPIASSSCTRLEIPESLFQTYWGFMGFPSMGDTSNSWMLYSGKYLFRNGWLGCTPISGNLHIAINTVSTICQLDPVLLSDLISWPDLVKSFSASADKVGLNILGSRMNSATPGPAKQIPWRFGPGWAFGC